MLRRSLSHRRISRSYLCRHQTTSTAATATTTTATNQPSPKRPAKTSSLLQQLKRQQQYKQNRQRPSNNPRSNNPWSTRPTKEPRQSNNDRPPSPFLRTNQAPNKSLSEWYKSRSTRSNPSSTASTAPSTPSTPLAKSAPPNDTDSLEGLRSIFLQSLESNRAARRNAAATNASSTLSPSLSSMANAIPQGESRLERLLRMSRELPPTPRKPSGVKAFREARKAEQSKAAARASQANAQTKVQSVQSHQPQLQINRLQSSLMKDNTQRQGLNPYTSKDRNGRDNNDRRVILPHYPMTLLQLSSLFRISSKDLTRTIRNLGEWNPSLNHDGKLDLDVAELVALELGLDPVRNGRGLNHVELAERRMLREEGEDIHNMETMEDKNLQTRPPVVCIMGHVDHGKTTLMDCLRRMAHQSAGGSAPVKKTKKKKKKGKNKQHEEDGIVNVAGTEAGGITQVVSAFQIPLPGTEFDTPDGGGGADAVTFMDTPGHAAFKAMRQSGSNGADVIVLVIASDDGVSPQTREILEMYKSIARAQQGSISLMVAMTKIDKPGIDVEESIMRIENQLMEEGIFSERMVIDGSEFDPVQLVPVSGLTGEGVEDLIEQLALQSEIMDLRADPEARAEGLVIDAKLERGLGVVVDCIIRWGTLNVGDYVLSGIHGGKVRILNDVNNKSIKNASPSQPVRIVGLKTLPTAGEPIVCVKCEETAKEIIEKREGVLDSNSSEGMPQFRAEDSNESLDLQISGCASKGGFMGENILRNYGRGADQIGKEGANSSEEQIRIPVILKADADGTLAALRDSILAIKDESKLDILIDPVSSSIGQVTASDVRMAAECDASILCFNLKGAKDKAAMSLADAEDVEIRYQNVIYHLLDEAKDVFARYIPPTMVEKVHGSAKVKEVFDINNKSNAERIAGLIVEEGELYFDKVGSGKDALNCQYRVKRRGKEITSSGTEDGGIPKGLKAKSLRKVTEEVVRVRRGEDCGLNLENYTDYEEGDIIECFSVEVKREFV